MPEHPDRDGYMTPTSCPICGNPLTGRADQRYCTQACRQAAYRNRTDPPSRQAQLPLRGRSRREHTVYECGACGQRLLGEQWCPDCQRPAPRIGPGASCPHCDEPVAISDLTEAPMP